jgi:membrane associated rhomboid family serine protease
MHGGLPFIGVSVAVYGLVGAVAIARSRLRVWHGRLRRGAESVRGGSGGERGSGACAAVSQ